MNKLKLLSDTLYNIKCALKKNIPIEIQIESISQLRLVEILSENDLITIIGKRSGVITIKVKPTIIKINVLEKPFVTPKKRLNKLTGLLLKSVTGVIILSTDKGVMTHTMAMERNIGGIVIGSLY